MGAFERNFAIAALTARFRLPDYMEARAMEDHSNRMPDWLTTDLLIILISLAVIALWAVIAP